MCRSIFDVSSAKDVLRFFCDENIKDTFSDIRSVIRGDLKLSEVEALRIIDLFLEDEVVNEVFVKGRSIEAAAMLNCLIDKKSDVHKINIEKILDGSQRLGKSDSALFARGLGEYALGNYKLAEKAFKQYARISSGKPLYHRTAAPAFRDYVPSLHSEEQEPKGCGEFSLLRKAKKVEDIIVLVSCDIGFFKAYQADFLSTISELDDVLPVHFHIVCESRDSFLSSVNLDSFGSDFGISLEFLQFGNVRTYSALARYIVSSKIMRLYNSAIFISDIDLVIKSSPRGVLRNNLNKIGLYFGDHKTQYFPWHAIKAGAGIYPYCESSISFLGDVGRFMSYSYRSGNDGWMLDQLSIEYAYRNKRYKSYFYDLKGTGFPLTQLSDRGDRRSIAKKHTDISGRSEPLHYERDRSEVHERIRALPFSDFKVAVKTKDESLLIEEWLNHYGKIFGFENIFVFDNESTDCHVLDVYKKYNGSLGCLFQYGDALGDHNSIHYPERYGGLYEEISKKCKYFALLDTDEFLVYIEKNKVFSGQALMQRLAEEAKKNKYSSIIFGFWLNSFPGFNDVFQVGENFTKLFNGVKNGKHFVPSAHLTTVRRGHNSCVPVSLVSGYSKLIA